jgi:hypothetical protein
MKRHQQILLGALVLQVALIAVVFWPRSVVSVSDAPLFPELGAEDIVGLTIVDNEGGRLVLRKVEGAWALPEAGNYPVNESSVTPLLEKLMALSASTVVARTDASHRQLQVADDAFQRRLDLETQSGVTHTIYLGTAPRYTATHFRAAGRPETYLTTDLSTWEFITRPSSWIDTSYISINQENVTGVTLENANGTFMLVKSGEDWTLADLQEDEVIAPGKTNAIVRNATTLALSVPLGTTDEPSYSMASPSAVVTVQTEDGTVHTLTVGARIADDSTYVVKASDSPYYVRVAEFNVSAMVENDRDDFLTPPPTPEAEGPEVPAP